MPDIVLNLASIASGQYPVINFIKLAGVSSMPSDYPGILDANNYPVGSPSGTAQFTFQVPTSYSGNWVLKWSGQISTGTNVGIQFLLGGTAPRAVIVSGGANVQGAPTFNLSLKGSSGRVVFNFTDPSSNPSLTMQFLSTGAFSGFADFVLCREDHEALLDAGEIFNPEIITQLIEEKANGRLILRGLDWSNANGGLLAKYAHLPPTALLSYATEYAVPACWVGDTSGTDTYTCSNGSDHSALAYQDGELIHARVTNANTSTTPTLNRGSLGAKTIVNHSGAALSAGNISANRICTFVYNAILDQFLMSTGANLCPSQVPLGIIFALCNKVGADCWLTLSMIFQPAAWGSVAAAARTTLNSGQKFYPEVSNELWNFGFTQTTLAHVLGTALGWSISSNESFFSYYGLAVRQAMESITTNWSPRTSSELKRVMAVQFFGDSTNDTYRFKGQSLTTANATYNTKIGISYNAAPNRPIDYCDILSYATYYNGAQFLPFQVNFTDAGAAALPLITQAADAFLLGDTTTSRAIIDADIRSGTKSGVPGDETLAQITFDDGFGGNYHFWQTYAATYSKQIACYEGGCQIAGPDAASCTSMGINTSYATSIKDAEEDYKSSALFKQLVLDQFTQLTAVSPTAIVGWYYFCFGTTSQWSTHKTDLYGVKFKSYDAIVKWNGGGEVPASADILVGAPNVQAQYGFRHVGYLPSGSPDYQLSVRAIQSSYATAIYYGDPIVKLAATQYIAPALGNQTTLIGVFQGCMYWPKVGNMPVWSRFWPGGPQRTDATAYIVDAPTALFLSAALLTAVPSSAIGQNIGFALGATPSTTGLGCSSYVVDQSTLTTDASAPFQVYSMYQGAGNGSNQASNYNWVVVCFNNERFRTQTGNA